MKTKKIFYVLALLLSFFLFIIISLLADHLFGRYYVRKQLKQVATDEREYRISNPDYHHSFKPMFTTDAAAWGDIRYTIFTNDLGFKDASNRTVEKKSSKRRVLFIGDSFTESIGNKWEDSFVGMFSAARPDLEVLNAGVSSYYPELYYRKINWIINQGYHLDEVVVYIDISDIQDEGFSYVMHEDGFIEPEMQRCEWSRYPDYIASLKEEKPKEEVQTYSQRISRWVRRKFPITHQMASLAVTKWQGVQLDKEPIDKSLLPVELIRGMWTYKSELPCYGTAGIEAAIEKAKTDMDRLATLLKKNNIALSVGVYPWPDQLSYDKVDSRQVKVWKDWCTQAGCRRFINHYPDFFAKKRGEGWPKELFLINDAHFNVEGNRLMTDRIVSEFSK